MKHRRRGTTFAELLVYIGLLTTGVVVIAGLELGARRALTLQQALIDIEMQSAGMLGALRRDVEAARSVEVGERELLVHRQDGRDVRYEPGRRTETGGGLAVPRSDLYPLNDELGVSLEAPPGAPPLVVIAATFTARGHEGAIKRTFRRTASPRVEGGR